MKMMNTMEERWNSGEMLYYFVVLRNRRGIFIYFNIFSSFYCLRVTKMCEFTDFKSFDFQDHKLYELENDTDPEIHFYQNININCEYYSEDKFNSNVKMEGFSVIHFNSRSV